MRSCVYFVIKYLTDSRLNFIIRSTTFYFLYKVIKEYPKLDAVSARVLTRLAAAGEEERATQGDPVHDNHRAQGHQ